MFITTNSIDTLIDVIKRVNRLSPDRLDDTSAYRELCDLARMTEILSKELRDALTGFYNELLIFGNKLPELPMDNAPVLEIDVAGPGVRIEIDGILPFPITGSVYYLHEKLDEALTRFRKETPVPRPLFTEKCAVVFIHHYMQDNKALREIRDYDNMERRCILNVLARHFLRDDSPRCLISMDMIAPGERTFTEIKIMSIPQFQELVMSENIGYFPQGYLSKKIPRIYQKYNENTDEKFLIE